MKERFSKCCRAPVVAAYDPEPGVYDWDLASSYYPICSNCGKYLTNEEINIKYETNPIRKRNTKNNS